MTLTTISTQVYRRCLRQINCSLCASSSANATTSNSSTVAHCSTISYPPAADHLSVIQVCVACQNSKRDEKRLWISQPHSYKPDLTLQNHNQRLLQEDGAGRGLTCRHSLRFGDQVFTERPFVCHPAVNNQHRVCFNCLAVLDKPSAILIGHNYHFCSKSCLEAGETSYFEVEVEGCFRAFDRFCLERNIRLPLIAKRLACVSLTGISYALQEQQDLARVVFRGPFPTHWLEAYSLLQGGMTEYISGLASSEKAIVSERLQMLTQTWWIECLARLKINTFRVDCVFPLSRSLKETAVAIIGGDAHGEAFSGSALYLTASLFNHSCSPNVTVTFPNNDGEACFTAMSDVKAGDPLHISYIDSTMPRVQRQHRLLTNYGFLCKCTACFGYRSNEDPQVS